jgi:hypothetical protein
MAAFQAPLALAPRFTEAMRDELATAGIGGWYLLPAGSKHPLELAELDADAIRNVRSDVLDPATGDRYRVSYRAPLPERKGKVRP